MFLKTLHALAAVATIAGYLATNSAQLGVLLAVLVLLYLFHQTSGTIQWGRGNRRKR